MHSGDYVLRVAARGDETTPALTEGRPDAIGASPERHGIRCGTRVLLITNIFPPAIGGPATFIDRLAHELAARYGCRVTVICSSELSRDAADSDRPFRVRRVSTANKYRYQVQMRTVLALELARHSHVLVNGLEEYVRPIAALMARRYVLKVVGDTVWEVARNAGMTALDIDAFQLDGEARARFAPALDARQAYLEQASIVVTPSEYLRGMVTRWGVDATRVVTVPNGFDMPPVTAQAATRLEGALKVLFVGRLTNWKGVETLLLALRGLPGVEATIAGDGPCFPSLTALSRQLDLTSRVTFLGRQSHDAIRGLMAASHVLVLTSLYEGLSHTLIEAAACGVPCIASSCGGNPEFVLDGTTGLLVEPENVSQLQAALDRLNLDELLRRDLGSAARERASRFSMAETTRRIARLVASTTR
jgi:glycosyltransferase involved in cell wall biosynthesis